MARSFNVPLTTESKRLDEKKGGDIKIPFPVPNGGRILIAGWQKRIGSHNVQSLIFIFPNGQIHHDYTWREDADHLEVQMPAVKDAEASVKLDHDKNMTTLVADSILEKKD